MQQKLLLVYKKWVYAFFIVQHNIFGYDSLFFNNLIHIVAFFLLFSIFS